MRIFFLLAVLGTFLLPKSALAAPASTDLQNGVSCWDGAERIRYEVVVHDAVSNRTLNGAALKLLVDGSNVRLQSRYSEQSAYSAKTVNGTATLIGFFIAGGTVRGGDPNSIESTVRVRSAGIQCQAEGYESTTVALEPVLHFKGKEPRIVIVRVGLKRL